MNARKKPLHEELKRCYKEYFESKLAITLLKNKECLSAVNKVSKTIVSLLRLHKDIVLKQLLENKKIIEELFGVSYYGRLVSDVVNNPHQITEMLILLLENENSNLSQVMQVHAIFIYRIYPFISDSPKEKESTSREKSRIEIHKPVKLSKQLGIMHNKVFCKMIGDDKFEHVRAIDRFVPDCKSHFFNLCSGKNVPFVAGPSGHTESLMKGALIYGIKDSEELMQYALACFAFLAAGGNHSFNEVMYVANKVADISFKIDNYSLSLPMSFKQSLSYEALYKEFQEFLESPCLDLDRDVTASQIGLSPGKIMSR